MDKRFITVDPPALIPSFSQPISPERRTQNITILHPPVWGWEKAAEGRMRESQRLSVFFSSYLFVPFTASCCSKKEQKTHRKKPD
jgi:hypothetical protein